MKHERRFRLPIVSFHARPATRFVNLANKYRCAVRVKVGDQEVDGKSVLDLIVLQALKDDWFEITAVGDDADACLQALARLFSDRFHEEEAAG